MPLYVLAIGDDEPLSIIAHGDEGAEILMRSCVTGETPAEARVVSRPRGKDASWST